jgi:hypothetical protein
MITSAPALLHVADAEKTSRLTAKLWQEGSGR